MLFFSTIVKAVVVGLFGIGVGYFLRHLITLGKKESAELKIKQLLLDAKTKTQTAIEEANKKAALILEDAKREEKTARLISEFLNINWERRNPPVLN